MVVYHHSNGDMVVWNESDDSGGGDATKMDAVVVGRGSTAYGAKVMKGYDAGNYGNGISVSPWWFRLLMAVVVVINGGS
ncbi:hypothetical protein QVD17_19665 [Tagetes erecta]|uniref:Uncharacterized protein n=1 Tax=Tagetes erecta TaxID=13708 RepID=A0AAD8NWN8_TARER|nr:hypothetical protein QVD17_19665 [Tagetes erecta]